ncbi:MAG: hypothetical protein KDA48_13770, partial [Amphiplicatus sp.]|nr:hypothetical protein [Amphiplicatus sp.]
RFSDGARSPLHLHFDSRELEGGEPLGWIVENVVLRAAIFEAIEKTPEIKLFAPARVERAAFEAESAHVELSTGQRLSAPLIVAADGRNSALRRQAGIKTAGWQYGQTG